MAEQHELRDELLKLDHEILDKLADRKNVLTQITNIEDQKDLIFSDNSKKNQLLNLLTKYGREKGLDSFYINQLFKSIFEHAEKVQEELLAISPHKEQVSGDQIVVTFQGGEGAYSHLAGQKFFSTRLDHVVFQGLPTFKAILESIERGGAHYAVLPIENTTAGIINEAYDLLNHMNLAIVGEEIWPVKHCLVAIENVPLARIRRIYSHPQALAQCSNFLSELGHCVVESFVDTALAVKKVKEDEDLSEAAIASEAAAEIYGLQIIKRDIANTRENYTRFVIVAKEPVEYSEKIPCKTSLIFATKHVEGALVNCLNVLAKNHLNMTKLESRPRPNIPWEQSFYVDFEGNIISENVKKALDEFSRQVIYMKVLGSYPAKVVGRGQNGVKIREENFLEIDEVPELPKSRIKVPAKKSYHMASRETKNEDSLIKIKDVIVGGSDFIVIAGPCSVESKEQVFQSAKAVADNGGHILRGGVFKPRTSPYSFQGLGYEGLELLTQAGAEFGLPTITEVLRPEDVKRVAEQADVIQIGARNMQNFPLLREVGAINKPVMLKRGMMASIDEFLAAAEYILSQGNQQVILCERGIRTFETATRNTLDLSAVPVIKSFSHLPIIVDPSHAVGEWRWVVPMVEAALAAGAHGVMVEIHPEPEKALSDGAQSLKFKNFEIMMKRLNRIKQVLQ